MEKNKLKSFIKYPGGKSRLLSFINDNLPDEFNNYFEPFVGGGSVVLAIINNDLINKKNSNRIYYISDINESLINCYNIIKNNLNDLLIELKKEKYKNIKENYLENRSYFNKIKFEHNNNNIEKCALFIYLNKCGYNGMYRENSSGLFNIPFGSMKNPLISDDITLSNISNAFNKINININACIYNNIFENIKQNDFIYLDPPYDNTFTNYTASSFGKNEQKKLKEFVDILTLKKIKVMISNSATDFIKDLYKEYNIINLSIKYSLGGKNAERGNKQELLIMNY